MRVLSGIHVLTAVTLTALVCASVLGWLVHDHQRALEARLERVVSLGEDLRDEQRRSHDVLEAKLATILEEISRLETLLREEVKNQHATVGLETTKPSPRAVSALRQEVGFLQDAIEDLRSFRATQPAGAAEASAPPVTEAGSNPGGIQWSAAQVIGQPDTFVDGDSATAWAPQLANSGVQWVEVEFEEEALATGALVRETYNPGAVVVVEAIDANGQYHVVWEGDDPTTESPRNFEVPFTSSVRAVGLRVKLDTSKVDGWNEIDAIGLVAGTAVQWATSARASSSYAENFAVAE